LGNGTGIKFLFWNSSLVFEDREESGSGMGEGGMKPEAEIIEHKCDRYERALKAIAACTLTVVDFGDWVQACVEDVLDGQEPECWNCGTAVHEGPCVGEDGAANQPGISPTKPETQTFADGLKGSSFDESLKRALFDDTIRRESR
jgi:hypothetical protein